MPDISGIEFIGVFSKMPNGNFTIAYSEYAVKGFELDGVDYLLKPFSLARFTKACHKALELKKADLENIPKYIFIKTGYKEEKIKLDEI